MEKEAMRRYAALALDAALAVAKGDRLRVAGAPSNRELMREIAELAYERGAAFVKLEYFDSSLDRIRADRSRDEFLDIVPAFHERMSATFAEERWSTLYLEGEDEPDALEGADEDRVGRMLKASMKAAESVRAAQMSSRVAWCVLPAATEAWARKVLGPTASADELWQVLIPILGLDAPDPASALRAAMDGIAARCRALNALSLRELRFTGPGTDLRVALSPESRWIGGTERTPEGRAFMPNIPTAESFATPDFRGTEGRAAFTKPVRVLGSLVEGGFLRFEGGLVVEAEARSGAQALRRLIDTDWGARRLGEVALVDSGNAIARSGRIFDSALLDENAACHIALGAGYDGAFEGAAGMSKAEKEGRGFNDALVHVDFMIGSPGLDVEGVDASGREIAIMRRGSFVEA